MGSNEKYDEKSLLALMVFKEMIDSGFLSMEKKKKISLKIKEVYLLLKEKNPDANIVLADLTKVDPS